MNATMDSLQVVIIILLVLTVALFVYAIVIRGKATMTIARESKRVSDNANNIINNRTNSLLRLVGVPFLWAVRAEMLKDNYHQIEEYFNQYVKENGIRAVVLVDNLGLIKLSTDKKWEGKTFQSIYKNDVAQLNNVTLYDLGNEEKLLLSPITGINKRLGTVAILYHPKEV